MIPTKGRLLYVVTEDWYFVSHRLPMARAAQRAGWQVHVATRVARHRAEIEAEGFTLHELHWQRRSLSPLKVIRDVLDLRAVYGRVRPRVVHHVALKPSLIGGLASLGSPDTACINSLAGLGYVFTSRKPLARLLRWPLRLALGLLLNRRPVINVVQNPDDQRALVGMDVSVRRIVIIPGSGVDVGHLQSLPEPPPPVRIGFVGRMLEDKGLLALIEAFRRLRRRNETVELVLAGTPDPENPTSISTETLKGWNLTPGITWLGHVSDIKAFWASCHIAVLPSRREGFPKSLLEAAACGRPIVATDVPGCREIAKANRNALLTPPDDPAALAEALETLCRDPELRRRLGRTGRILVEENFSSERIGTDIVALYDRAALVTTWMNA